MFDLTKNGRITMMTGFEVPNGAIAQGIPCNSVEKAWELASTMLEKEPQCATYNVDHGLFYLKDFTKCKAPETANCYFFMIGSTPDQSFTQK